MKDFFVTVKNLVFILKVIRKPLLDLKWGFIYMGFVFQQEFTLALVWWEIREAKTLVTRLLAIILVGNGCDPALR